MTHQHYQDLPPAKRRRLIVGAVLRSLLVAAVLVAVYYLLPLDRPWDAATAIGLLAGLLVIAAVITGGVKITAASPYPGVRAAETLAGKAGERTSDGPGTPPGSSNPPRPAGIRSATRSPPTRSQ